MDSLNKDLTNPKDFHDKIKFYEEFEKQLPRDSQLSKDIETFLKLCKDSNVDLENKNDVDLENKLQVLDKQIAKLDKQITAYKNAEQAKAMKNKKPSLFSNLWKKLFSNKDKETKEKPAPDNNKEIKAQPVPDKTQSFSQSVFNVFFNFLVKVDQAIQKAFDQNKNTQNQQPKQTITPPLYKTQPTKAQSWLQNTNLKSSLKAIGATMASAANQVISTGQTGANAVIKTGQTGVNAVIKNGKSGIKAIKSVIKF